MSDWAVRICEQAGVARVTAHGLRGTHASLAAEVGVTAHALSMAMGHASEKMTFGGCYATAQAAAKGRQKRVLELVPGDASRH